MKDFMPKKNQQKKLIENVLAISAKARKEKEMNPSIINATVGSYYDESGKEVDASIDAFRRKTDDNGRIYFIAHLAKPIKTNKVRFGVQSSNRTMRISELIFITMIH